MNNLAYLGHDRDGVPSHTNHVEILISAYAFFGLAEAEERVMRKALLPVVAAIGVGTLFGVTSAQAVTLSNTASGSLVGDFGSPSPPYTPTYGEVFTAPITGTLTSFTLFLSTETPNSGVQDSLYGGVGAWNGPSTYGPPNVDNNAVGYGVSSILYTSPQVPSYVGGPYTFSTDIPVTAGNVYVAFVSVYGEGTTGTETAIQLGNPATDIDYMVWENVDSPSSSSWNYFFDYGPALFTATFDPETSATPLPAALPLFATGLGALGLLGWRRKRKAQAVA